MDNIYGNIPSTEKSFSVDMEEFPNFFLPHVTDMPYSAFTMLPAITTEHSNVTDTATHNMSNCPPSILPPQSYGYPHNLLLVCLPVIVLLGTIGNVLSIIVLKRRVMQMTAASFYLIVLAIPDLTVLYFSALKTWIRLVFGFELLHVSNAACKITKYIFFTSTHLSAWLVVAITIERLMVVCFPFKAPKMCCHRQAQLITVALVILIMGLNLNIVWASELVINKCGIKYCTAYQHSTYMHYIFPKINLFVYSLVPFTLVLIMNLVIISSILKNNKLFKQHQQQMQLTQGQNGRQSRVGRSSGSRQLQLINQRRLTCTLLTISFLWFTLTGPYAITDILNVTFKHKFPAIVRIISYLLMYVNHAINFYIYCLTGRKFRYELRRVFCRTWKPPAYQKVPFKQPPMLPNIEMHFKEAAAAPELAMGLMYSDKQLKGTVV